jgi:hypothetical protein
LVGCLPANPGPSNSSPLCMNLELDIQKKLGRNGVAKTWRANYGVEGGGGWQILAIISSRHNNMLDTACRHPGYESRWIYKQCNIRESVRRPVSTAVSHADLTSRWGQENLAIFFAGVF